MKDIRGRIEDVFTEIAFAEEREIRLLKNISGHCAERLDELFTAVTFAEAGEFDAARRFIGGDAGNNKRHFERRLPRVCAGRA